MINAELLKNIEKLLSENGVEIDLIDSEKFQVGKKNNAKKLVIGIPDNHSQGDVFNAYSVKTKNKVSGYLYIKNENQKDGRKQ